MSTENSSDLQETAYEQQASLDHANTQAPKMPVENPQLTGVSKSYALAYHQLAKARLSETEYAELRSLIKQCGKSNGDTVPIFAKLSCLLQDYPNLMRGFRMFLPPGLQLPFQTGVFLLLRKMEIEKKESSSDVNCKLEKMSNSPSEQMFEASTSQGTNANLSQSDSLHTREDQNLLKKINEKYVNSFMYKVKDRFKEEPQVHEKFAELLHYMSNQNRLETDALLEILDLFQGHEDLVAEFKSFIPNVVHESPSGQEEEEEEDTSDTMPTMHDENSTSQHDSTDISRITAVNDPSIASVYKYGTYEDHLFFDKVKAALGYEEVYNNFLRCLMLFNDDIVTRSELVQICTPFLGTFPELYKKFKDMLGFNENGDNVEYIPMKIIKLENVRNKSGIAADIDFSAGGRNGASYLPLAPDFKHPKCSGRTPLCDEVLNDTWVSFPTWSEDSTFVTSCKTQYEEIIYRCEDERFELDMAISANNYTLQILENVQKKINKMTAEEKSMFSLDDYLGGTSLVHQRKALHRLYGDKTEELVEGLKRNPVVAVPIILKRLKVKEEEWREKQKQFNEIWRSLIEQYYLKSLDHQGINFKQNDSKTFRPKGILNDLEMVLAESKANPQQMEPHFTLEFKEVEVFLDAINLMLQYLKKLPGVYRDDRRKIELVIRSFIPYIFDAPSATKIGSDLEIDEEIQGDSMDADNDGKERSGQNSSAGSSKDENEGSSEEDSNVEDQSRESDEEFIEEIDVFDKMDPLPTTNMPYTLFFVSKIWFVFFRQFHILFERLAKFLHESNSKEALVKQNENEDMPSGEENPESLYKELIESLTHLLNGVIDYSQFEEKARSLFGIHAYFSFTMDKLILSIVRQLQQVVTDDICKQCTAFFNQHTKKISTGGCTSGVEASQIEHQYLRKVEKMMDDEQVFKVIFVKNPRILTIELLEVEETSPDPIEAEKWSNYLDTYFDKDSCCEELLAEVQQSRVFLPRNLRKQMLFWKNRVMQVEKQWHQRQSSKSMKKLLPLSARKKRALSIIAPILRKKPRCLSISECSVQPSCSGVVSNDGNEAHSFDNSETIKPVGKFFKDIKEELDVKEQLNKIIVDDQVIIESEENLKKPDIPEKEENFLGNESVVIDAVSSPNAQTGEVSVESPKSFPEIADQNSKETSVDEATKEEAEKMEVDKDTSPEKTDDSVIELEDASEKNISEEKSEDIMVPESSLKATDSDTDMQSKGDMVEDSVNCVLDTNKDPEEEEGEAVEDSNSVEKTDETEPQAEKSIGKKQLKRRVIQKTSEYSIKTRKNRIKRKMKRGLLRSSNSSKRKQRQTKRKFKVLDDPTFDFDYFSELPESDKVSHLVFKYVTAEDNEEVTFMKGSQKIRFVQNSGFFAHRKDSLTRAQETHQAVSEIKASNFNAWHRIWLERYVTPSMIKSCNDWLLRSDPEKFKLMQVTISDCTKPPYIPYYKYKVCYYKTFT